MISKKIPNIKGLIIDMDGVLWHDSKPLGNLDEIFNKIRELDLRFILATNNATRSIQEYKLKLAGFDVDVDESQIINSAQATGNYLQENYSKNTVVYVIGELSLKKTIEEYGMIVSEDAGKGIEVVIASLDYNLSYQKLKEAALLLQEGCDFIGTNPDTTLPTPEGFIPGSGTIIGALEIASGRKAKFIGKPEPFLYETALKRLKLAPQETLAIGDRLETDIAGAQIAGIHTALVLSGASTLEQAQNFLPEPEIIAKDLRELIC